MRRFLACAVLAAFVSAMSQAAFAKEARNQALTDMPSIPRITFPHGSIESLSATVAWMAGAHDACEVRIGKTEDPESAAVWRSGVVQVVESRLTTPPLPSRSDLFAFVRVANAEEWGPWSKAQAFRTPDSPVLRIERPAHAGRVRGPDVEVTWTVESHDHVTEQSMAIDGGKPIAIPTDRRAITLPGLADGVHTVTIQVTAGGMSRGSSTTFYVYRRAQQSASKLYTLDISHLMRVDVANPRQAADAFDTLHTIAVLQGLVNRERAQLYIKYIDVDSFWLEKIREKGAYLEHAEIVEIKSLDEAVRVFSDYVKGAVVWTENLPCTSNIASTICGVEDLLPVRYDDTPGSLYDRLIRNGPKLKIAHNLVGKFTGKGKIPDSDRDSTGSRKCDAYLWAKMRYLDTGRCNPRNIGYWCDAFWLKHPRDMSLDNVGLTNHDYVVARRGFFCDLNVWPDEAPRDDPDQREGLDREVLQEILLSCHNAANGKMIHFAGFTPWAMKYTNVGNAGGKHDAVPTEWETARIVSAYNGYMDADAIGYVGMANASVFSLCELPDRLVQNPPPTRVDLEARGYIDADGNVARYNFVYHYLGDYDSAAWMYRRIPEIWRSPVRGQVHSGWAFNPSLTERLPIVFDWCYETKSPNDYFVAGDSGSGYVNPTQLLPPRDSGLPSGEQAWIEHNIPYYRRLNYSLTGFIINGFCGETTDLSNRMFLPFSGDGVMTQPHWMPREHKSDHLLDGMPVAVMKQDITAPVDVVVEAILKHGRPNETQFLSFRSILVSPDWIKTVNDKIRAARPDCRFEPVDPYTYFYLLKHSLGAKVERRATYTFDTMPDEVKAGQTIKVTVGLRNDGWDTWLATGPDAIRLHVGFDGRRGGAFLPLESDVPPGGSVVVSAEIKAPAKRGECAFHTELLCGNAGWFGDAHDMPWEKRVIVR
jgi:hypothetical protein